MIGYQSPAMGYLQNYLAQALMPAMQNQANMQQTMTPPMIHAAIIQYENDEEIRNFPVQQGTSQMFMRRDDGQIVIKSMEAGGPVLAVYDRRPPEPQAQAIDPAQFVRRDELRELIAAAVAEQGGNHEPV